MLAREHFSTDSLQQGVDARRADEWQRLRCRSLKRCHGQHIPEPFFLFIYFYPVPSSHHHYTRNYRGSPLTLHSIRADLKELDSPLCHCHLTQWHLEECRHSRSGPRSRRCKILVRSHALMSTANGERACFNWKSPPPLPPFPASLFRCNWHDSYTSSSLSSQRAVKNEPSPCAPKW